MRSRLCAGHVIHRRVLPVRNEFRYGVYYCLFDLDEVRALDRLRLFSYQRRNIVSLMEADHFGREAPDLARAVAGRLAARGIDLEGGHVTLLTNARVLGYVFNPVSFYFCHDRAGALATVIAEVHNTRGEEHVYDLDLVAHADGSLSASTDKAFYVSPFIEMDARYDFEFRIDPNGGRYDLRIAEFRDGARFFEVRLDLTSVPFTDRNLGWMLVRYPLVTLQTIGLIHWQALKLWRRGVRYRKNPRRMEVRR